MALSTIVLQLSLADTSIRIDFIAKSTSEISNGC